MAWQLIYSSAPRGLLSGQSGFCTVARSGDLREALVQRLERLSSYHYLKPAEAATANRNPTICAFRILDLRGTKYHVLTRIQPCGLDFTSRTNHLAHHLVFQASELGRLPSPAAILRYWDGWLASWQQDPRILADLSQDAFGACDRYCLPAQTWMRVTGDAGRAAGLLESECVRGFYLVCPNGGEAQVLEMFCETLQLLNPNGQSALGPWHRPFTTFLQAEDDPADFQWRACQEGTPAYQQAVQRSAPLLALAAVRVPDNALVQLAREGLKPTAPPPVASPPAALGGLLPEERRSPMPGTSAKPTQPPKPSRRSYKMSLIRAYAPVKLSQTMMQRWFSNQSAASRAGLGIFVAAVLLGLMAMVHWGCNRHAKPASAPAASSLPVPSVPAPGAGTPVAPAAVQTPPPKPVPVKPASPDPKQWAWLLDGGQTFVFFPKNMTNFTLPIDSISQFQRLINDFDRMDTLPTNIQMSVSSDKWAFRPAEGNPMQVSGLSAALELSAKTDGGLSVCFNYSNWISSKAWTLTNPLPVVVKTTFAEPPRAFSVQLRFSSSNDGAPFRLLFVDATAPPPAVHLPASWLQAGLDERLIGEFTFLQGQRLQHGASKMTLIITDPAHLDTWLEVFRFDLP
ncbi:MAG: hypothetical protein ABSF38_13070 [Verrucomicrobiota bacterium]|jgi:hypothetical protein